MCSENKGADQLCFYREADLCLFFCICQKFSHVTAHIRIIIWKAQGVSQ